MTANEKELCDVPALAFRQPKFITNVQYGHVVQHLFVSWYIGKLMLPAGLSQV